MFWKTVIPYGYFDSLAGGEGYCEVSGWACDPDDTSKQIDVHVYIGGPAGVGTGIRLIADVDRADVGKHGFWARIPTDKTGNQDVYVYAINIGEGNDNTLLGRKTVNIEKGQTEDILYSIDSSYTNTNTGFHTSGWVIAGTDINRLTYSINGGAEKVYSNWVSRQDVNNAYPSYPQTPCGFSINLDWTNFKDGKNTVVLKAYTNGGGNKVISDVYFNMAAPSGYSITSDKTSTYIYENNNNNFVNISYSVSNNVYCTGKLIVEKNGSVYTTADIGTIKSKSLAFNEAGTYYIYLELKNSAGTVKGSNSSGVVAITVTEKVTNYTVNYNANGGSGAPGSQTKKYGTNLTLSSVKPTRTGYTFQGWATSSSGTTAQYQAGGTYSTNANVTLYAVWKINTSGNNIVLEVASVSGSKGGYVDVPVVIKNNKGIASFNIGIKYDNSVMYPVSYSKKETLSDMISTLDSGVDMSKYGEIKFVWDSTSNIREEGTIFTIKFKIKDNAVEGRYNLNVNSSNTMFTNSNLVDISYTSVSGKVTISNIIKGDVNGDTKINGKDVVLLRQYVAGWPSAVLSETQREAADVTNEGAVNGKDIVKIRQYIAGWPGITL